MWGTWGTKGTWPRDWYLEVRGSMWGTWGSVGISVVHGVRRIRRIWVGATFSV